MISTAMMNKLQLGCLLLEQDHLSPFLVYFHLVQHRELKVQATLHTAIKK